MKKNKTILGLISLGLLFSTISCSQLQSSLSSTQTKQMLADSGIASLAGKSWYYNGVAGENMKAIGTALSDTYETHNLKINFSKKVALTEMAGSMKVAYLDGENYTVTKTITDLDGTFSEDAQSFYLDMSKVVQLLDGVNNPSGIATVELQIGGFCCAEGKQKGRPLPALIEKITVKPLFKTETVDFSTCWYEAGKSEIVVPLNTAISLVGNTAAYSVEKQGCKFEIAAGDNSIVITPKSNLKGVVSSFDFVIPGILPEVCGTAYSKNIQINLVDRAIVIDGKRDINYDAKGNGAVVVEDAAGDQSAFDHDEIDWVAGMPDITSVSIVNDDENLYIGVAGTMAFNWNDKLVLMICKNGELADATASNYMPAEKTSYWKGRPNIYLYHMPGFENSGKGSFNALKGESKTSFGGSVKVAPYGWTDKTNSDFIEYAIPLTVSGLKKGDKLKIIAAASLKWDEGLAACDTVPDAAIRKVEGGKTVMQFDFENGIEYIVK